MSSVNKVILVGNCGKNPEAKSFPSGGKIVEFSVATSERWTDKQSGEKKEKTEWHRVVVRNEALCRVVENYVRKGSKLYIEGQLQTREWQDKDGNKRYQVEIIVGPFKGEITLLDTKQDDERAKPEQRQERTQEARRSFADDLGDDIPFD
jgi:single-strand DNA-binding protein